MRFLLLNQFYPPDDAPTGRMLHDLAVALVRRGHEASVVCSSGGYDSGASARPPLPSEGVSVLPTGGVRLPRRSIAGRLAAYLIYLFSALRISLRSPKPDLVLTMTTPPFLGLLGTTVTWLRKTRHAQWVMDVYPDALRAHWPALGGPIVWWLLTQIARLQFWEAACVVGPGPCVEDRLRRYMRARVPLSSVALWSTIGEVEVSAAEVQGERELLGWDSGALVLMYSGNMGLGHTFVEFLGAAQQTGGRRTVWAFVGDGPRRREVEKFASANPSARIEFPPPAEATRLPRRLAAADIHLVSIAPGWEGIMVPSKLQNAFMSGRPVIFVGPPTTAIARWIREAGAGWVVPPRNVDALLQAIDEGRDADERARRGEAAQAYARIHFDRDRNCAVIVDLLERCLNEAPSERGALVV